MRRNVILCKRHIQSLHFVSPPSAIHLSISAPTTRRRNAWVSEAHLMLEEEEPIETSEALCYKTASMQCEANAGNICLNFKNYTIV